MNYKIYPTNYKIILFIFGFLFSISIFAQSQNFFDSDGDGVFDNIDIDDDNDGIKDAAEELACRNSPIANIENYKFLNETFGTGTRTTINTTYDAVTTYQYESGSGDLNDGEYTVGNSAQIASWANEYWYKGIDHTGDTNGRMALFNASDNPGLFYSATIKGALPNVPVTYSFWVINLDRTDAPGISTRKRPNIKVEFRDVNDIVLETITTGDIAPTTAGNLEGDWYNFSANLTFNVDEFYVYFYNNETGGLGNDLAIDDIVISQTLCDTDGDGVADVFDLDSDNDGIPDVVESGNGQYSNGTAKIASSIWSDTNNGNGMHDASEIITPLDSDGDGVPNYLDLDSDNDTLFDVDESGAGNANDINGYENGDGDINGDGVGDGSDSDAFRETDIDSNGILEYFADGILDTYDYFYDVSPTYANSYGNNQQGLATTGWVNYVIDTDNDGIPDYMDVQSNGSIFDIASTLYSNLDSSPLDGIIDDPSKTDTDGDGILDVFDTDNTKFGSPRDLNRKLSLYFDGRNDYIEEDSGTDIVNGLSQATMMAWVKLDANFSENGAIAGQSNFWFRINGSKRLRAEVNEKSFTATVSSALKLNKWIHVAAVYDGANSVATIKLYVNGKKVGSTNTSEMRPSISTSTSTKFRIGRNPSNTDIYNTTPNMFFGEIDEVRVFNKALTDDELQKMICQELDENNNFNRGAAIPLDISGGIGANLIRYYRMDAYKDDILDDLTTTSIDVLPGAKMYNIKHIYPQTAPLPYETKADGDWATVATWLHGDVWDIANEATNKDWSIVHIKNNLTTSNRHSTLGLIIDDAKKLTVQADNELKNTWYLELDGAIDLVGESQLVQTEGSILDEDSGGYLERDQQGTANSFNYNYWSSSVGPISGNATTRGTGIASTNANFTIKGVLWDGNNPDSPSSISFNSSYSYADNSYSGAKRISTYWLYKFNGTDNDYGSWVAINQNSSLLPGEGYTMKGTSGSVPIATLQNYVFKGRPYNGDFTLPIAKGNDRLIGNPYPSALDADEFIKDNIKETINSKVGRNTLNIFNGALYFWNHFGQQNTHILREYVGGYATYTLMGGVKAISNDYRIKNNNALGTKIPKQYIPVGQGFFVIAALDGVTGNTTSTIDGGDIVFKNSQRIYKTEGSGNSVFMKGVPSYSVDKKNDNIVEKGKIDQSIKSKIWLCFDSPAGYHRQLLVGVDENASKGFDIGYDAPMADVGKEDMYWMFEGSKFVIQGVNNFTESQKLPLGITVFETGSIAIGIEKSEGLETGKVVCIKDKLTGKTYNISQNPFEMELEAGTYEDRFSVIFKEYKLMEEDVTASITEDTPLFVTNIKIFMNNTNGELQLKNTGDTGITSIALYNYLGQTIKIWDSNLDNRIISLPMNIASGFYLLKINTEMGVLNKKIMVE